MPRQEVYTIIEKLEEGREHVKKLKEEREKLIEANKMLVDLVQRLETKLKEETGNESLPSLDEQEYSFGDGGWRESSELHEQALNLDDEVDLEKLERQINEVIATLNDI